MDISPILDLQRRPVKVLEDLVRRDKKIKSRTIQLLGYYLKGLKIKIGISKGKEYKVDLSDQG